MKEKLPNPAQKKQIHLKFALFLYLNFTTVKLLCDVCPNTQLYGTHAFNSPLPLGLLSSCQMRRLNVDMKEL